MNNNSLKPFIKFMAIVLGGLFLIIFIYEVNSEQKRSCAAPGCKDQPIYGSDYCYQHRVNDENYEVESDSQESKTTALEEATTDSYYEVDYNSSSDDSNSYSGSYSNSSSSSGTYSNSSSSSSYKSNSSGSSSKKKYSNPYKSYDDGYEDVYMDDDYDDDRYNSDSDYADGVDDALDDYDDGDW